MMMNYFIPQTKHPAVVILFNQEKKNQKLTEVTVNCSSSLCNCQRKKQAHTRLDTVLLSYMCLSMFIILVLLQNCRDQKPPDIFEKTASVVAMCFHFLLSKCKRTLPNIELQRWYAMVGHACQWTMLQAIEEVYEGPSHQPYGNTNPCVTPEIIWVET